MNTIEYAIKLYAKHLLKWDWFNLAIGLFNLLMVSILSLTVIGEHGQLSSAELSELASGLEIMLLVVAVAPFAGTALALLYRKLSQRLGRESSDELWPEVQI